MNKNLEDLMAVLSSNSAEEETSDEQNRTALERKWEEEALQEKEAEMQNTDISEDEEAKKDLKNSEDYVLLDHYNRNCSKCSGRGHIGMQITKNANNNYTDGCYVPCPKCFRPVLYWLNLKTGLLVRK